MGTGRATLLISLTVGLAAFIVLVGVSRFTDGTDVVPESQRSMPDYSPDKALVTQKSVFITVEEPVIGDWATAAFLADVPRVTPSQLSAVGPEKTIILLDSSALDLVPGEQLQTWVRQGRDSMASIFWCGTSLKPPTS